MREEWNKDLEKKPKLSMLKKIVEGGKESSCSDLKSTRERMVMLKLRGGTAAFQVETGRWQGVKREDRVCQECSSSEVEDVTHWLLRCPAWSSHRQPLLAFAQSHTEDQESTAYLLSHACRNYYILSIMSMWYICFRKHYLGMYVILVCSSTDYLHLFGLFAVYSAALDHIESYCHQVAWCTLKLH